MGWIEHSSNRDSSNEKVRKRKKIYNKSKL